MTAKKTGAAASPAIAARLVHDVGKYIARTARNLPSTNEALPPPLHAMLLQDLYGAREAPARRPRTRFSTLAATIDEPRLGEVRALFDTLDTLEDAVRAGQPAAVSRAVEIALRIEELLRALSRDAKKGTR